MIVQGSGQYILRFFAGDSARSLSHFNWRERLEHLLVLLSDREAVLCVRGVNALAECVGRL